VSVHSDGRLLFWDIDYPDPVALLAASSDVSARIAVMIFYSLPVFLQSSVALLCPRAGALSRAVQLKALFWRSIWQHQNKSNW
jgi:hypothetical protein